MLRGGIPSGGDFKQSGHDSESKALPSVQEKNAQGEKGRESKGSQASKKASGGWLSIKPRRPTEGVFVRRVAAVLVAAIWFIGAYQLYNYLVGYDFWRAAWGGASIPLLELPINMAMLSGVVVFLGGGLASYLYMNRSAPTDFLVETETEMKKVTWPTKDEASNASLVVIGTVVVIGCLLALFDVVLNFLFKFIF